MVVCVARCCLILLSVYTSVVLLCVVDGGVYVILFVCQAEDGIRDLVRSRGLGDVYKRQVEAFVDLVKPQAMRDQLVHRQAAGLEQGDVVWNVCLLYTSDAADERSSVDLGGRRIIKKKNTEDDGCRQRL